MPASARTHSNAARVHENPPHESPVDGQERTFTISELSAEFGITNRAIRFYEDKQLLSPARSGQRRIYSRADRARLKLVLRAKRLGWPLDEIRSVIEMYDSSEDGELKQLYYTCDKIDEQRQLLLQQMDDIQSTLQDMKQVEQRCRQRIALLSPDQQSGHNTC